MLVYALTIFLSAFLLFQVQPMIAKIILPWFGGSAAVWSTCMMYFQLSLLCGYLYAHALIGYVRGRQQFVVHGLLLAASLALLPIYPSHTWKPDVAGDPTWRIVLLLAATIGLPYFLLSATSPLLQAWYLRRSGAIPYRLFALSNFASLMALLSFPFLIEPFLTSRTQSTVWSWLYAGFALACAGCAWITWTAPERTDTATVAPEEIVRPNWRTQLLWVALATCASALLLGVTNQITYNVAAMPFLWILPLTLYLLTFILCFESDRAYVRGVFVLLLPFALGGMAYLIYAGQGNPNVYTGMAVFSAGLFVCCMVCHGELSRLKPHPRYLTLYFLLIATGGALGGLFVATVAPHVFNTYAELPVAMVACALLTGGVLWNWGDQVRGFTAFQFRYVSAVVVAGLSVYMAYSHYSLARTYRMSARNFYGSLRVRDQPETDEDTGVRMLVHGTIIHGEQLLDSTMRNMPTSYYGISSGVGLAMRSMQRNQSIRAGVVGLGAGVLASYGRVGDSWVFYELNPLARDIASTWFTFLNGCKAQHQVLMGDARLVMERQPDQGYNVLALDAFSSDSIPVHLLTREAFELYFRHLKPDGILAVHLSNKYLDLRPIVAANAQTLGKAGIVVEDDGGSVDYLFVTTWALLSSDHKLFQDPMFKAAKPLTPRPGVRLWTDDYSNLVQILK